MYSGGRGDDTKPEIDAALLSRLLRAMLHTGHTLCLRIYDARRLDNGVAPDIRNQPPSVLRVIRVADAAQAIERLKSDEPPLRRSVRLMQTGRYQEMVVDEKTALIPPSSHL